MRDQCHVMIHQRDDRNKAAMQTRQAKGSKHRRGQPVTKAGQQHGRIKGDDPDRVAAGCLSAGVLLRAKTPMSTTREPVRVAAVSSKVAQRKQEHQSTPGSLRIQSGRRRMGDKRDTCCGAVKIRSDRDMHCNATKRHPSAHLSAATLSPPPSCTSCVQGMEAMRRSLNIHDLAQHAFEYQYRSASAGGPNLGGVGTILAKLGRTWGVSERNLVRFRPMFRAEARRSLTEFDPM